MLPTGYGARFDAQAAPRWLRLLVGTPLLDRLAYPLLVRRGHTYLTPSPALNPATRDPFPSGGWQLEEPDYVQPGSVSWLQEHDGK